MGIMNKKKLGYILSVITILAVLSASILMYIDLKNMTNFTIISAPKQKEVISPIKVEKSEVNYAEIDLGINLALGKRITANNYTQVYVGKNTVDGDVKTYWEGAADSYPNTLVVDLEAETAVKSVRIKLNPNNMWERRKQTLSIQGSLDDKSYTELSGAADFLFDPASGNAVIINFNPSSVRYLKLEFTDNTAATGGQAAEIELY